MKKCPFCAEEIQDEAIKCRYCGEFLKKKEKPLPWYFSNSFMFIVVMCVGPFVLPLIILHPTMSKTKKIVYSVVLLVVTFFLIQAYSHLQQMINEFGKQFDSYNNLL